MHYGYYGRLFGFVTFHSSLEPVDPTSFTSTLTTDTFILIYFFDTQIIQLKTSQLPIKMPNKNKGGFNNNYNYSYNGGGGYLSDQCVHLSC